MVPAPVNGMILDPDEYRRHYEELLKFQDKARSSAAEIAVPLEPDQLMIDPAKLDLLKGLPKPEDYDRIPRNGETLVAGDVIVILESPDDLRRHDELVQHVLNWVFRTQEIRQYNINEDPAGESVAIAEALELEQQIRKTVRLNLQRVVRATTGGTLVAAKRLPEPPRNEVDAMKLGRWTGTPLDPENAGCLIEAGQEIASIAPSERLHAVMYIDQGDRDDLQDEMPLEIKLDHMANITFLTRVDKISPKGEVMAPESLTTRFHGPLATKANQQGQEQLASTAYRAIAGLYFAEDSDQPEACMLKPGMRGNGRFIISNRTAAYWMWRYVCETFRFRV